MPTLMEARHGLIIDTLREMTQRPAPSSPFQGGQSGEHKLREAMGYSLLAGGKRLRPVLCLTSAALICRHRGHEHVVEPLLHAIMPFACALECIHTYSLIHDDLPAMDNDDMRRGQPTCHKKFGEAQAILAGDALLTDAFGFMASLVDLPKFPPKRVLLAIQEVAHAAGSHGMVLGQSLDMLGIVNLVMDNKARQDALASMDALKTGALIEAACVSGAILAGAESGQETDQQAIRRFAAHFGLAFQISDDILDVVGKPEQTGKSSGKDNAQKKATWPALLGLEASKRMAEHACAEAEHALGLFADSEDKALLVELVRQLPKRNH